MEVVGAGQAPPLCSLAYLELAHQELRVGSVPQREAQTIFHTKRSGTLDKQNLGEGSEPWFLVKHSLTHGQPHLGIKRLHQKSLLVVLQCFLVFLNISLPSEEQSWWLQA